MKIALNLMSLKSNVLMNMGGGGWGNRGQA